MSERQKDTVNREMERGSDRVVSIIVLSLSGAAIALATNYQGIADKSKDLFASMFPSGSPLASESVRRLNLPDCASKTLPNKSLKVTIPVDYQGNLMPWINVQDPKNPDSPAVSGFFKDDADRLARNISDGEGGVRKGHPEASINSLDFTICDNSANTDSLDPVAKYHKTTGIYDINPGQLGIRFDKAEGIVYQNDPYKVGDGSWLTPQEVTRLNNLLRPGGEDNPTASNSVINDIIARAALKAFANDPSCVWKAQYFVLNDLKEASNRVRFTNDALPQITQPDKEETITGHEAAIVSNSSISCPKDEEPATDQTNKHKQGD